MTDLAAIQANYIDKQYMKTTGAVRYIFEVQREFAEESEAVMGLPSPDKSKWCGIAHIKKNEEPKEQP